MMLVTFSSLYSFNKVDPPRFDIPHLDKAVHFSFYFVGCILGILFFRERTRGSIDLKKAVLIMLFLTILYGIGIEILQYLFTAERTGDVLDALANTIGSICGALLMKFYFSGKSALKWKF